MRGGGSKRRVQLGRLQRARGLWHEAWEEGRSGQKERCWTWGAPGKEGTRRVREKENRGLCKGGGGGSSAEQLGTPGALLGSQRALGPPEEHRVAPSLRPEGLG